MVSLRRPLVPVVLASLLLTAGCGGDDDSETGGGGDALTAAEYRKQGNALCREAKAEVERIPAPTTPGGLADYLEKTFDIAIESSEEFEGLNPPAQLREAHLESVRQTDEARAKFEAAVEAVRRSGNPIQTVQTELRKLAPLLEESERLNRELGLAECNEIGAPSRQPDPS